MENHSLILLAMMTNARFKNRVYCIGYVYDVKLNIQMLMNVPLLYGSIILKSNDNYIEFYIRTFKTNYVEYYRILETFGVQYQTIAQYDKSCYTLEQSLLSSTMGGNIVNIKVPPSKNPSMLCVTGEVTERGNLLHYAIRYNGEEKNGAQLNGVPYDNKFITPYNFSILNCECSKTYNNDINHKYLLESHYTNGFDRDRDVISNIRKPLWSVDNIRQQSEIHNVDEVKYTIALYDL